MNSSFRRSLAACLALPVSVLLLSGCSGKTEDVRIVLCKEVTDRLLADPALRRRLGEAGRARVLARFTVLALAAIFLIVCGLWAARVLNVL